MERCLAGQIWRFGHYLVGQHRRGRHRGTVSVLLVATVAGCLLSQSIAAAPIKVVRPARKLWAKETELAMYEIVWKRQLYKQIEDAGYWRFIYVAEGGGSNSFWVFQEDVLTRLEVDGKLKDVEFVSPGAVACKDDSKEAAIKRAEEYLVASKSGGWVLSQESSVG